MSVVDLLITNVNVATMSSSVDTAYGTLNNAAVALCAGKVHALYEEGAQLPVAKQTLDAQGQWLTPGLIDCHTHAIWGGNRAREFEWRLQGRSYQEIAQAGGGIASTVSATRQTSAQALYQSALTRTTRLMEEGVTTLEIKSGYGLSLEHERTMLEVARQLGENNALHVVTTLLAAHALPPEFDDNGAYIDEICQRILPQIAALGLADAVDVFCEGIGFSREQCAQVFDAAVAAGLPVKGHVEQLSDLKGASLVAQYQGLSADHIEYLAEQDVPALKRAGTVAVLLPGAFYALKEQQLPPIAALREHGVPMAVSTDLNPGTSPQASLRLAMNQACIYFGLTPQESLAGVTREAARALGLGQVKGQIAPGYDADLVLWDIEHPCELSYGINLTRPEAVFFAGVQR
ncbi:MAG: imidazolonepropionase [Pseudomonadales bacterium]